MKRETMIMVAAFALAPLACGLIAPASNPSPEQPGVETIVAATVQSLPTTAVSVPKPTIETPNTVPVPAKPAGTSVNFQNVSILIPAGLASSADAEIVPASSEADGGPWSAAPEYIRFTLKEYPAQSKDGFNATVSVYPAGNMPL